MTTQVQIEQPQLQPGARKRLESERQGITHRFNIAGLRGYITVGLYKDGTPGELFIRVAKCGSTLAGLLDSLAIAVSLGLQHGISLHTFAAKYIDSRFEPSGLSGPEFGEVSSIVDYIFRWLTKKFPEAGIAMRRPI
jgi:ribonucleoside-diphosphate reductase alpha chain